MFEGSYTDEKKKKKKKVSSLKHMIHEFYAKAWRLGERARKIPISSFIEIGSI